jgi:phosphoserine phosphatase RsbU/P
LPEEVMAEKILIVDDLEDNRDLMTYILSEMGYEVEGAGDGQEAVQKAFTSKPDLILLDVLMPKLSGYEVCEILKKDPRTTDIPVIFLSAMGGPQDKIRGLEIGGVDYITKPFNRQEVLARVAVQLKIRRLSKEILEANKNLKEKQKHLDEDLKAAAGIQQSLLPQKLPIMDEFAIAWKFLPSDVIGGDIFNIYRLDDHTLALYMIDVSGHGVPSALITVSISQALQPHNNGILKKKTGKPPYYRIQQPRAVLNFLDREYPLERFGKIFTVIYAIIDIQKGRLIYSSAGHPPPVLLHADGSLSLLEKGGPIIGLNGKIPFEEGHIRLRFGDVLIFHTDGIVEFQNDDGVFYGTERFYGLLKSLKKRPIGELLDAVIGDFLAFGGDSKLRDDVSLLGMEYQKREGR